MFCALFTFLDYLALRYEEQSGSFGSEKKDDFEQMWITTKLASLAFLE